MDKIKRFQVCAWTLYLGDAVENELDRHMSRRQLTLTQARVLRLLAVRPGCSPGDVARLINRDESTTTGILKRLEVRGLVRRAVNEHDRRQAQMWLTDEGQDMYEYYQNELMKLPIFDAMSQIPNDDIEAALRVFRAIGSSTNMTEFVDLVTKYSEQMAIDKGIELTDTEGE